MLKVIHLSKSDIDGGAARAAYRIHRALLDASVRSCMWVDKAIAGDWTVQGPKNKFDKALAALRPHAVSPIVSRLKTSNPIIHSPAILPSQWINRINASDADLVHLHWVQGEMLSIADIGNIKKPVVWTLHDMWAFCGAEHYTEDSRWRDGYHRDNRPVYESGLDLNRWVWERKTKCWKRPMYIVGDSTWMARCAAESQLMKSWPIRCIFYPLNLEIWKPIDKLLARNLMGLSPDKPLLAFGAIGGGQDPRKGFDLLLNALKNLKAEYRTQGIELIVFGQNRPETVPDLGFPINYIGHLHDDISLRLLYSAADALVVPSRQEAFGQTAAEAHACATPVISFNIGGLPDIIEHKKSGYLANPFDTKDLAHGIDWVLSQRKTNQLGIDARKLAEVKFSPSTIASQYLEVYHDAIG